MLPKHALWIKRGILIVSLTAISVSALFGIFQGTRARTAPAVIAHSVPHAVAQSIPIGPLVTTTPLAITVALHPNDPALLQRFATEVVTPGTPSFRHFLTSNQFAARFGPPSAIVANVQTWLKGNGWHIEHVQSGGMYISATATAAQANATFGVTLIRYRATDGSGFYANATDIALPAALAPAIIGVVGLDNIPIAHPAGLKRKSTTNTLTHSNTSCPPAGNGGYTYTQLTQAYRFPGATGSGLPHLALVEFDGYALSDITTFAQCFAPNVNLANVLHNRLVDMVTPLTPGVSAIEDELDIEIALAMAPSIAQIDVYEAPNIGTGWIDLFTTLANDNLDGTVSISWGSCEAIKTTATWENTLFQQMAAQGQDVFASSGDTGAYDCVINDGKGTGDREISADFPASSPYVVAVGGTTLQANNNGIYQGETVWNNYPNSQSYAATGGGYSQYFYAPTWQVQAHVVPSSNYARVLPDIAADADPQTGYFLYCTVGTSYTGYSSGWQPMGGTSASAPLWASLAALTNQAINGRIGLITPALYALYGADTNRTGGGGITYSGTTFFDYAQQMDGSAPSGAIVFRDIISGTNSFPGFPQGYSAQRGYDMTTGLGSMQGQNLIAYLAKIPPGTGPTPPPTPTIGPSPTPTIGLTPTVPPFHVTPQLYLVGQGTNQRYWISTYLPGIVNDTWTMLDPMVFQGSPAITDDHAGNLWFAGIGSDQQVRYGRYSLVSQSFAGWNLLAGMACLGRPAAVYARQTLFITCRTTSNGIAIDAYNTVNSTWGGWAIIGGGLQSSPTMASDGTTLLIVAQAPQFQGDQSDWYTYYTLGTGATTLWRNFRTTCLDTPSVAWQGTAATFTLGCVADDTGSVWTNLLTATSTGSTLDWWVNAGSPAGIKLQRGAAIITDLIDTNNTTFLVGMGLDRAAYVTQRQNGSWRTWQRVGLPGIFLDALNADYWGQ